MKREREELVFLFAADELDFPSRIPSRSSDDGGRKKKGNKRENRENKKRRRKEEKTAWEGFGNGGKTREFKETLRYCLIKCAAMFETFVLETTLSNPPPPFGLKATCLFPSYQFASRPSKMALPSSSPSLPPSLLPTYYSPYIRKKKNKGPLFDFFAQAGTKKIYKSAIFLP